MTYEEALRYYAQIDMMGSHLGLDRMAELLRRLGNPEKQLKFVHVAGTNGKGPLRPCWTPACVRQDTGWGCIPRLTWSGIMSVFR